MREAAERQLATISSQQGPYAKFIEALIVQVGSYFFYRTCFFALVPIHACLRPTPHQCVIEVLSLLFVMQWDGRASTWESAPEVDNWTTKHPCLRTTQHAPSFQLIIILLLVGLSFNVREREKLYPWSKPQTQKSCSESGLRSMTSKQDLQPPIEGGLFWQKALDWYLVF